jgi:hypothetical protein
MEIDIEKLQQAEDAFWAFDGNGNANEILERLRNARPRGFISHHGQDNACRVIIGSQCLTPLHAVPEAEAIALCHEHRIQTEVRYVMALRKWIRK